MQREFTVRGTCDEIVAAIRHELYAAGFRVEQPFELRSALALVPHCTCPHHGTALCDCQYIVLLIYGQVPMPATLVVHGRDHWCWLALADDPHEQEEKGLAIDILHTLAGVHPMITVDGAAGAALQAGIMKYGGS